MDIGDDIDNRHEKGSISCSGFDRQSFKITNVLDQISAKRNDQTFKNKFRYITFSLGTLNQLYL